MSTGDLRVVDRLKDLVVSGGVNVSPTAVEAVLTGAPGVRDVCVTGAPDEEWGERVVAFVVAEDPAAPPTVEALREFAGDHLSRVQLPKQVVLVDAIPRAGREGAAARAAGPCMSAPLPSPMLATALSGGAAADRSGRTR